jgi:hypothetical protein
VTGWNVILGLKIAVLIVTAILLSSFIPLIQGNYRLHGRINMGFFALTGMSLLLLEYLAHVYDPQMFDYFDANTHSALRVHLCFALPAVVMLPLMLITGLSHRRRMHLLLAGIFAVLWIGTVFTGLFRLPHSPAG